MYFLITATFPDFKEHNQVFSTKYDIKPSTIQNSLVAKYNFYETASCQVSKIDRWEAMAMAKRVPHTINFQDLVDILDEIPIYQQNKK